MGDMKEFFGALGFAVSGAVGSFSLAGAIILILPAICRAINGQWNSFAGFLVVIAVFAVIGIGLLYAAWRMD